MGSWVGEIYAWSIDLDFLFCTQPLQPQIFWVPKFKVFEAMQPQIRGYEINKKLWEWNLYISLKIQSFTEHSLNSLHFNLWGQACTEVMESFTWSFWHQECRKLESESFEGTFECGLGRPQNGLGGQISRIIVFCPQKKVKAMKCNEIHHSSCKDISLAWKICLHGIIKNIVEFQHLLDMRL